MARAIIARRGISLSATDGHEPRVNTEKHGEIRATDKHGSTRKNTSHGQTRINTEKHEPRINTDQHRMEANWIPDPAPRIPTAETRRQDAALLSREEFLLKYSAEVMY